MMKQFFTLLLTFVFSVSLVMLSASSIHGQVILTLDQSTYQVNEGISISISQLPDNSDTLIAMVPSFVTKPSDMNNYGGYSLSYLEDIRIERVSNLKNNQWYLYGNVHPGFYKIVLYNGFSAETFFYESQLFYIQDSNSGQTSPAFTDVPETDPAYFYIMHLVNHNIIKGYEDNTFKPDAVMTRAEFTKIFALTFGFQPYSYSDVVFSDLPSSHWAYPSVMSVKNYISFYGTRDNNTGAITYYFQPGEPMVRKDVAYYMYNVLGLNKVTEAFDSAYLSTITDFINIPLLFQEPVARILQEGVMTPIDNQFLPEKGITRREACMLLAPYLSRQ